MRALVLLDRQTNTESENQNILETSARFRTTFSSDRSAYMYTYIQIYINICVCIYTHKYVCVCVRVRVCVYVGRSAQPEKSDLLAISSRSNIRVF